MIDQDQLGSLVRTVYGTVAELGNKFPGRHFTLDGRLFGCLGECLFADAYPLSSESASNK
ncbi:DUF6998 domain-containing protein [Amphritea pacifica]|uniref:DUF6998 domain-containing protein n=1 Tax=Amphritea pacifica TaxID=2811233 RepID=UPI0038CC12CD